MPADGETRSNMHAGGTPVPTALTEREREICAAIGPTLKARGLIFVGIDVIGGDTTRGPLNICITAMSSCNNYKIIFLFHFQNIRKQSKINSFCLLYAWE